MYASQKGLTASDVSVSHVSPSVQGFANLLVTADEGGIGSGVRRDWLNSMMTSMLDPQTGLFESADGGHTWQPCPLAPLQDQHLVYFEMLGQYSSEMTATSTGLKSLVFMALSHRT